MQGAYFHLGVDVDGSARSNSCSPQSESRTCRTDTVKYLAMDDKTPAEAGMGATAPEAAEALAVPAAAQVKTPVPAQPKVSFSELFRLASKHEKCALVLSGVAAAALGAVFPLFSIGT